MRSEPVSSIDILTSFIKLLTEAVQKLGGSDDDIRYLVSPEGESLFEEFAQRLMERRRHNPWQEATARAYGLLGLSEEHSQFQKEFQTKEVAGQWVLTIIKGVTCNNLVNALQKAGVQVYSCCEDLDKEVMINDRDPGKAGSYVIAVKAAVEADKENANKSADQLAKEDRKGMTLLERLFLEMVHFLATGEHLDRENVTLCAGSRFSDGSIPNVFWDFGRRKVFVWPNLGYYCSGVLRSRSASVLPTEA